MQAPALRTLQTALHLPDIDGRLGPQTRNAVQAFLQQAAPDTQEDWRSWPAGRQAQLALQLQCRAAGFDPGPLDGLWGPQSRHGAEQLAYLQAHGQPPAPWRQERVPPNPNGWPLERSAELRACYGEPGEAGLVSCPLPYPLRLAWDPATRVERLRCHARVAPSLGRVLARVLDHYGIGQLGELGLDLFGGCYQMRDKRGGSALSTHAWGIALDIDPHHNQLRWNSQRARFARPEYEPWWQCWEAEGWVSLGRSRNYDWMHVQAARL